MKEIAKLCLNSSCDTFGLSPELDSPGFIDNYTICIHELLAKNIKTNAWVLSNDNCVEHHYRENEKGAIEAAHNSEITANFTIANAQIRLYNFMVWLDLPRLAQCDTGSCCFLFDAYSLSHKDPSNDAEGLQTHASVGNALGQWEDGLKKAAAKEFIGLV